MAKSHGRAERREGAAERAVERAKRTPQQQLGQLDKMFGQGKGAKKERARLKKQLQK